MHTILIGSGKGGVGKSTVSVNLAVALAKQGLSVGLLDADLYGPSLPVMFGLRDLSPRVVPDSEGKERLLPFFKFGVKVISIGFFLEEARSILWRGPMLHGALQKMIQEVDWGHLDILLIDLPPGTGDVPISLCKLLDISAGIIVSTPQEVAILDALKAIHAFDQLDVPLMGIIENMSGFVGEDGRRYPIFGEGKAAELAQKLETPLLGRIPLLTALRIGSDEGYPAAYHQGNSQAGLVFHELAATVLDRVLRGASI